MITSVTSEKDPLEQGHFRLYPLPFFGII